MLWFIMTQARWFGLGSNVSGQDEGRSGDESVGSNEASGRDDRRLA